MAEEMSVAASGSGSLDTFPKLLAENVRRFGDKHAMREKEFGIWQSWTWRQLADEVRALACGLAGIGIRREDKVAIIGDNRPALYGAMCAVQAAGGIPVPMYQDSVAEELQYVLDHAEARFAIVEDQEQVDKLLEIKDRCPKLEQIIFTDSRGMRHYKHEFLQSYKDVQAKGREFDKANPGHYDADVARGKGGDVSIILYTSGTTTTCGSRPRAASSVTACGRMKRCSHTCPWHGSAITFSPTASPTSPAFV